MKLNTPTTVAPSTNAYPATIGGNLEQRPPTKLLSVGSVTSVFLESMIPATGHATEKENS